MNPVTRIEHYLSYMAGEQVAIPVPVTRVEFYLAIICGEDYELPTPVTRIEQYLYIIAGGSMDIPEPATRVETYLAAIAGMEIDVPVPVTRKEMYLSEWVDRGGLPAGYDPILGLTFNNNAYYDITGFKMRGSDTLRFSFMCTMSTPACNVLGAYDASAAQTNYSLYLGNSSSAKYLRYNGSTYSSQAVQNTQYDVVIAPTGSTGMETDSTWTEKTFESVGDLCVGTTSPTATSSKMVGDITGNIVVDGRLKLIPCKRLSDNVVGYYDTYSGTFYEPTGEGVVPIE